jgi:hypothetical protein
VGFVEGGDVGESGGGGGDSLWRRSPGVSLAHRFAVHNHAFLSDNSTVSSDDGVISWVDFPCHNTDEAKSHAMLSAAQVEESAVTRAVEAVAADRNHTAVLMAEGTSHATDMLAAREGQDADPDPESG